MQDKKFSPFFVSDPFATKENLHSKLWQLIYIYSTMNAFFALQRGTLHEKNLRSTRIISSSWNSSYIYGKQTETKGLIFPGSILDEICIYFHPQYFMYFFFHNREGKCKFLVLMVLLSRGSLSSFH